MEKLATTFTGLNFVNPFVWLRPRRPKVKRKYCEPLKLDGVVS